MPQNTTEGEIRVWWKSFEAQGTTYFSNFQSSTIRFFGNVKLLPSPRTTCVCLLQNIADGPNLHEGTMWFKWMDPCSLHQKPVRLGLQHILTWRHPLSEALLVKLNTLTLNVRPALKSPIWMNHIQLPFIQQWTCRFLVVKIGWSFFAWNSAQVSQVMLRRAVRNLSCQVGVYKRETRRASDVSLFRNHFGGLGVYTVSSGWYCINKFQNYSRSTFLTVFANLGWAPKSIPPPLHRGQGSWGRRLRWEARAASKQRIQSVSKPRPWSVQKRCWT
jgi:hypothetical protein